MYSIIFKKMTDDYRIKKVNEKIDIRRMIGTDKGHTETIYLSDELLLFYNFEKLEELKQMTGRVVDRNNDLSFFCGDFVVVRILEDKLSNITDEDLEYVKNNVIL